MAIRLDISDPRFESLFAALLAAKREVSEDVDASVRAIVDDVRKGGDEALLRYTEKFDRL
jgi:histidinol dehydrogenase